MDVCMYIYIYIYTYIPIKPVPNLAVRQTPTEHTKTYYRLD